ncbi:erythronate-4-phosphate dehydrogenase [Oleiphilus sp. HI0009]|nr:erythronate-4-phosphate dehydrogenase [Oleiphilus sp. HI0009]KZX84001.1 erythronate-4-phosphate dehydrogenase [Oleiphilus sp. HI0009]KZY66564.1 erythronate-4-phosphate dehydrogenase [Oleiphilus sp. HI0066]KZY69617.1 erythronate-4-phosphate dehydrogenase [Oleiphilus sp. HI0067]KZZ62267.1 erythronate-4-phosphate dehydrogenase [Oleiphilus sp. HI0125]
MKIVADENIPLLGRFFSDLGQLQAMPGREITNADLKDADILLVRSVTAVNEELLASSKVRFVGSCTAGIDHVDTDFLSNNNIRFASAPGANANSVVEYILSCISILADTHDVDYEHTSVGIVGYGNVGSLLDKKLRKLGVKTCVYDPFVSSDTRSFNTLEEVLECDVVSLHVPLTDHAEYPTRYMIDEAQLDVLNGSQVLINTARGGVIRESALKKRLSQDNPPTVILDVWENEPNIDVELAKMVYLGTPHIAGYSFDGKVSGTERIYQSVCHLLGLPTRHSLGQFLEEPPLSRMSFTSNADTNWCLHTAIRACFDVRHDSGQLMRVLQGTEPERTKGFDALRKNYRCRREFSGVKIQLKQGDSELFSKFKSLGFNIK